MLVSIVPLQLCLPSKGSARLAGSPQAHKTVSLDYFGITGSCLAQSAQRNKGLTNILRRDLGSFSSIIRHPLTSSGTADAASESKGLVGPRVPKEWPLEGLAWYASGSLPSKKASVEYKLPFVEVPVSLSPKCQPPCFFFNLPLSSRLLSAQIHCPCKRVVVFAHLVGRHAEGKPRGCG